MLMRKPIVLLTGFGPFPGIPDNASSLLVPRLRAAAARAFRSHVFVAEILPTEWSAGPERMRHLMREIEPDVALHFGVAPRAKGFEIEARGRNLTDGRIDAAGAKPEARHVVEGGEEYLASNLPVREIVQRLRGRGLPARISRSAGRYLCNCVMYQSLALVNGWSKSVRNGFIHLPATLVDGSDPLRAAPDSPLTQDLAIEGGLEIIAVCLDRLRGAPVEVASAVQS